MLFLNGMWKYYILIRMLIHIKFNPNIGELHVENSNKYREQCFSANIIFVYIYFWNFIRVESLVCSSCVYKSCGTKSCYWNIFNCSFCKRKFKCCSSYNTDRSNYTIFSVIIISFTVFAYFYQKGNAISYSIVNNRSSRSI